MSSGAKTLYPKPTFEQVYELIPAAGLDKQEIWTKVIIEAQSGSGIYLVTCRWVSNNIGAGVTV